MKYFYYPNENVNEKEKRDKNALMERERIGRQNQIQFNLKKFYSSVIYHTFFFYMLKKIKCVAVRAESKTEITRNASLFSEKKRQKLQGMHHFLKQTAKHTLTTVSSWIALKSTR